MDPIRGDRVTLRPFEEADRAALKAIRDEPEVERWWGRQTPQWPGDEEWDLVILVIDIAGEPAGALQFTEEADPDYRHADVDIFLATRFHGDGHGTDAMRTVARHLIEDRGHHRITLSTSPHNERAIRAYEKVGFRRVGITRLSERTPEGVWRDELLMELVVQPRATGA